MFHFLTDMKVILISTCHVTTSTAKRRQMMKKENFWIRQLDHHIVKERTFLEALQIFLYWTIQDFLQLLIQFPLRHLYPLPGYIIPHLLDICATIDAWVTRLSGRRCPLTMTMKLREFLCSVPHRIRQRQT